MKIIQLAVTPDTEDNYSVLYALTDTGQIFYQIAPTFEGTEWAELTLPSGVDTDD